MKNFIDHPVRGSGIRESTNSPEPLRDIPQIPSPSPGVKLRGISFFPRRDNNFAGNLTTPARSIEIIQLHPQCFSFRYLLRLEGEEKRI